MKNMFCKCYQHCFRGLQTKSFVFVISVAPRRVGGCTCLLSPGAFFLNITVIARRSDTLHGLKTLYIHSPTHFEILLKVPRHFPQS